VSGEHWWLSFCDPERPKGKQFLGAAIVEAGDMIEACRMAWALGCNPGGEVAGLAIPSDRIRFVASTWRNRLLTKTECDEMNAEVLALLPPR
jgi:hypothetical protein